MIIAVVFVASGVVVVIVATPTSLSILSDGAQLSPRQSKCYALLRCLEWRVMSAADNDAIRMLSVRCDCSGYGGRESERCQGSPQ